MCSLDLDAWINEPPSESESEDEQPKAIFAKEETKHSRPRHTEVDEKELARVGYLMIAALLNGTSNNKGCVLKFLFISFIYFFIRVKTFSFTAC